MEIEILQNIEGAKKAKGLAVIIDVFRALRVGSMSPDWSQRDKSVQNAPGRRLERTERRLQRGEKFVIKAKPVFTRLKFKI